MGRKHKPRQGCCDWKHCGTHKGVEGRTMGKCCDPGRKMGNGSWCPTILPRESKNKKKTKKIEKKKKKKKKKIRTFTVDRKTRGMGPPSLPKFGPEVARKKRPKGIKRDAWQMSQKKRSRPERLGVEVHVQKS